MAADCSSCQPFQFLSTALRVGSPRMRALGLAPFSIKVQARFAWPSWRANDKVVCPSEAGELGSAPFPRRRETSLRRFAW